MGHPLVIKSHKTSCHGMLSLEPGFSKLLTRPLRESRFQGGLSSEFDSVRLCIGRRARRHGSEITFISDRSVLPLALDLEKKFMSSHMVTMLYCGVTLYVFCPSSCLVITYQLEWVRPLQSPLRRLMMKKKHDFQWLRLLVSARFLCHSVFHA